MYTGRVNAQRDADDQGQDDGGQEQARGDPYAVAEFCVDERAVGASSPIPASHDRREPVHVAFPGAERGVKALKPEGIGHLLGGRPGNAFLFQKRRLQRADGKEVARRRGQENHEQVSGCPFGEVPEHVCLALDRRCQFRAAQ
jgi:hypothetical protein